MTTKNPQSDSVQRRRKLARSIVRTVRRRADAQPTPPATVSYWTGTFEGWETLDTNLMQVTGPGGNTIRFVPTFYHVKNTGTWTAGTTPVTIEQYGSTCRAIGIPIGDPTVAVI